MRGSPPLTIMVFVSGNLCKKENIFFKSSFEALDGAILVELQKVQEKLQASVGFIISSIHNFLLSGEVGLGPKYGLKPLDKVAQEESLALIEICELSFVF